MASSSSSSSGSAQVMKKYDVFISFRGENTRNSFVSYLHGLLQWNSINVFIDNEVLRKGDEISRSVLDSIEESTISVIVFSEGYASSSWCLDELVKIIECKKMFRQIVLPVFYHVDPSHVRNQTGTLGDGFAMLVESLNKTLEKLQVAEEQFKDKVRRWMNALTEAANLSGYTVRNTTHEFGLVQKLVKDILEMLNYLSSSADNNKDLVGIEPTIYYIINFLLHPDDKLRNLHMIGIWGMGGMGKTTIAEAIFNRIRTEFEASYFALNVRERSSSHNALVVLRQELISSILDDRCSNINFTSTKKRLGGKRVVIVFDDVTNFRQIEFLIGDVNCLGQGSRIIITTRDKQVLRSCGIDEYNIYKIGGLLYCQALQLFSRYAFRQNHPTKDYDELSNRVVEYTKGVPLALKVLGSLLLDKPKEVWESALSKLKIIPHEEIQEVLKVSYDGLNDVEKNIFLDIACFLKWENREFAIEFLNACGFYAELGMSVLIDKCLIAISNDNKLTMHDLLQEMGWEIVRQESTKDPSERSRLWHYEDIYNVLEENTGTKAIEAICLDMSKQREIVHLHPCGLEMMSKLRFFKLHNSYYEDNNMNKVHPSQGLTSISSKLRYLCWYGWPLKSLPSNFHPKNLVALDMPHSNIEQLWIGTQLVKLKHIDLSYSKDLKKIQDLSFVPNLENLILAGCSSLFEISTSIQSLNKLVILNLRHCKSICSLPMGIHLESLQKVILSRCSNLKLFPDISCNIEELLLDDTGIEKLPSWIENLSRLVILNLKNSSVLESLPSNICKLKSLQHLNLSGCSKLDGLLDNLVNLEALKELNLSNCCLKELPNNLGQLSSLEIFFLGRNNFEGIPASIEHLAKLTYLDLGYCERLQSLPELPSQLQVIDAQNCTSLEASSSLSFLFSNDSSRSVRVNFSNCFKLDHNAFNQIVKDALHNVVSVRKRFSPRDSACICFPGNKLPEWLTYRSTGSAITLRLPAYGYLHNSSRLIMCAIVEFRNCHNESQGLVVGFNYRTSSRDGDDGTLEEGRGILSGWNYGNGPDYVDSDHVFLGYDSSVGTYNTASFSRNITIEFYVEDFNANTVDCCNVKECGVWHSSVYRPREQCSKRLRISSTFEGESSSREKVCGTAEDIPN